jgi:hypothetical protein
MSNAGSGIEQTASGLFVPKGAAESLSPEAEMAARMNAYIEEQVSQIVFWAERWPKTNERPLARSDIVETCLVRARAWLWPRDVTETITRRAVERMGLAPRPPQETRQQARARQRAERAARPLTAVPPCPLPPERIDDQPADTIEAGRGFSPPHVPRTEEPL